MRIIKIYLLPPILSFRSLRYLPVDGKCALSWGVLTHKEGKIFVHVMDAPEDGVITLPFGLKPRILWR